MSETITQLAYSRTSEKPENKITLIDRFEICGDTFFKFENANGTVDTVSKRALLHAILKGVNVTVALNQETGEPLEGLEYIELMYVEIYEEGGEFDVMEHIWEIQDGTLGEVVDGGRYIKTYKTLKGAENFSKKRRPLFITHEWL